ncbi:MAG: OmpH family outer membrane protein, partial [Bacteroidota bacterium]
AQSDLQLYGEKLQENIERIQLEGQKFLQQLEDPDLPDARRKELEGKLQEIQGRYQKASTDAQQQYGKKQNELFKPIYDKMQSNIEQYAKSKGYTFVMKIEASLLEPEEHNISDAVLQQMGVTPVTE